MTNGTSAAKRYMGEWCCIREKVLGEGSSYFYEKTLENRKSLAAEIKRQFEKLPAELLYKAKNLDDGDEFDLDLVIGELMDKRAGHTPSGQGLLEEEKDSARRGRGLPAGYERLDGRPYQQKPPADAI